METASGQEQTRQSIEQTQQILTAIQSLRLKADSCFSGFEKHLHSLETALEPLQASTLTLGKVFDGASKVCSRLEQVVDGYLPAHQSEERIILQSAIFQLQSQHHSNTANLDLNSAAFADALREYCESVDRLRIAYVYVNVTAKLANADPLKQSQRTLIQRATGALESLLKQLLQSVSDDVSPGKMERLLAGASGLSVPTNDALSSSNGAVASPVSPISAGTGADVPDFIVDRQKLSVLRSVVQYLAGYEADLDLHGTQSAANTNYLKCIIDVRSKHLVDLSQQLNSYVSSSHAQPSSVQSDRKAVTGTNADIGRSASQQSPLLIYCKFLLYILQMEWLVTNALVPVNATASTTAGGSLTLSRSSKYAMLRSSYDSIISAAVQAFYTAAEQVLVKARRSIVQSHDYTAVFGLVEMMEYVYLDKTKCAQPRIKIVTESSRKAHQFIRGVFNEFTATAFKAFSEFLDLVRDGVAGQATGSSSGAGGGGGGGSRGGNSVPDDGTVHELSSTSMSFLRRLSEYPMICELLLRVLEHLPHWDHLLPSISTSSSTNNAAGDAPTSPMGYGETEDLFSKVTGGANEIKFKLKSGDFTYVSMKRYLVESLDALVANLEQKARSYRKGLTITGDKAAIRSSLASIFLLNNLHFVLKSLRGSAELMSMLGDQGTVAKLQLRFEEELNSYIDTWTPLVSKFADIPSLNSLSGPTVGMGVGGVGGSMIILQKSVNDDNIAQPGNPVVGTLSKTDRNTLKDLFTTFNADFEDALKSQRRISVPDTELRLVVVGRVKEAVVPMYASLLGRVGGLDFSKSPEKYLRYSCEGVDEALGRLFSA